jgi:hypothetical protein
LFFSFFQACCCTLLWEFQTHQMQRLIVQILLFHNIISQMQGRLQTLVS